MDRVKRPFVVRGGESAHYQPANHTGTRNRRLIGEETVGARMVEMVIGELDPGGEARRHAHPGIEQVCFMLEGRARVECDGREEEIGPGDACFSPPDTPHRFTVIGDRPVKVLVIYSPPYGEDAGRVRLAEAAVS